jgi:DNA uptake protein ComE-like DNA-binding protein
MRAASLDELAALPGLGSKKAKTVFDFLHSKPAD